MTTMKRGDTAQVVLLPEGEIGEAVLRLAERWTIEGLLDPVYWVPASSVREHANLPALVSAIVMGRTQDGALQRRECRLLATLSGDRLEEVVVTSVRWLAPGQEDRDTVSAAAERLLRAIRESVPTGFDYQGEALSGTDVRSINIVLAATAVTSDEVKSLLSSSWQDNIVVSPESRQRPAAADTFNDAAESDAWAAFIAASVASISGLWTGMTSSPIPRSLGSGMVTSVPRVRVARTFTRAVVSSGYTFRLARSVASRLADSSTLLSDPMVVSRRNDVYVLDDLEADAEIARALSYLKAADSGRLSYQGLPAPEQLAPKTVGLRAVSDFLAFALDKIIAIPNWTVTWIIDRASRKTQESLYGDDTGVTVDLREDAGLRKADRDLLEVAGQLQGMRQQLQAKLDSPIPTVHRVNAPTLWASLRSVLFSLADGGSDSTEFETKKVEGRNAIIGDLGLLVPLPNERWELPDDATRFLAGDDAVEIGASWAGVKAAEALLNHLNETAVVAEQRVRALSETQEQLLNECFVAERAHVDALHTQQDAEAVLRVQVAETEIFEQLGASS